MRTSADIVEKTRPGPQSKQHLMEALLTRLQCEIEHRGDEASRRDRRLLMRGFRAAAWAILDAKSNVEVEDVLRQELFGQ